jgi:hypothetical protein
MFAPISNFVWKKNGVYMTCEMNPEYVSSLHLIIDWTVSWISQGDWKKCFVAQMIGSIVAVRSFLVK